LRDAPSWRDAKPAGCSTFAGWQVVESLWASKEQGLDRFVTEQPPYNLLDRRIERELLPVCDTYGLGVMPWSPLAGGFLSGKYKPQGERPEQGRYTVQKQEKGKDLPVLQSEAAYRVVEGVEKLAQAKGCTTSQLALAWVAQQSYVTSPIIAPRKLDQLEDNLKAMDITITEQDRETIDGLIPPGTHVVPFYEAQFGPHR